MTDLVHAVVLGIVQGITEWFPISSSGHLVLVQHILNIKVPLAFDVMLHFGTLLALLLFVRNEVQRILTNLVNRNLLSEEVRVMKFILIGTIPVTVTGYLFHDLIETLFTSVFVVSIALILTGTMLLLTKTSRNNRDLTLVDSLLVGISQACAIIPGISRSGVTISTGLLRGIDTDIIVRYAFLLSIPTIIGANLYELLTNPITHIEWEPLLVSVGTSAIVGYLSLKVLYRMVKNNQFHFFSFYCFLLGVVALMYSLGS
jgi:undecaprenyl-diphosphatase